MGFPIAIALMISARLTIPNSSSPRSTGTRLILFKIISSAIFFTGRSSVTEMTCLVMSELTRTPSLPTISLSETIPLKKKIALSFHSPLHRHADKRRRPQPPQNFSPISIGAPAGGTPHSQFDAALRAEATVGPVVVVTGRTAHWVSVQLVL